MTRSTDPITNSITKMPWEIWTLPQQAQNSSNGTAGAVSSSKRSISTKTTSRSAIVPGTVWAFNTRIKVLKNSTKDTNKSRASTSVMGRCQEEAFGIKTGHTRASTSASGCKKQPKLAMVVKATIKCRSNRIVIAIWWPQRYAYC